MSLKTTGLPATSSVIATDLVAVVTDPPGTPTSQRITAQHLAESLAELAGSVDEAFVEGAIDDALEAALEDLLGGVQYQGTWNATTNSPTIPAAATGNKGHYYKVATAGSTDIDGITDWQMGDVIVSNGSTWDKWDHTTPAASETVAGLVELATDAEAAAGTDTVRAVTPSTLFAALGDFGTVVAAGTNEATAAPLIYINNSISAASSGLHVKLPTGTPVVRRILVHNKSMVHVTLWPFGTLVGPGDTAEFVYMSTASGDAWLMVSCLNWQTTLTQLRLPANVNTENLPLSDPSSAYQMYQSGGDCLISQGGG